MSSARLAKITDNVWVDPVEVVAVHAEKSIGGTRIHLYAESVHTSLTVEQVLEALRRQDRQVSGQ